MNSTYAVLALATFYFAFLAIGVWIGRRKKTEGSEGFLLANRRLPLVVGIATMTATWVGGGYIVGTAESVYDSGRGLLWTHAPWCYALSLILGGLFFARRMHQQKFTTILDLFERRYGKRTAAVLYLPALCGELFWAAAILTALGSTTSTILGWSISVSIIVSASIVVLYTLFGGLWAVAYTDVLQLTCILFGLGAALYFSVDGFSALMDHWTAYKTSFGDNAQWRPSLGQFRSGEPWVWQWCDYVLLLILGGIPWQVYFQRVLACRTPTQATLLSVLAGVGCLVLAVPSVLIGAIGANTDWTQTAAATAPEAAMVLPYVLSYLTPPAIAIIGLAALAAAVMSSVDSSLLSAGSMFTWNVYRPLIQPTADEQRTQWVMRAAIIVLGIVATTIAIQVQSVYALWYLCADLVYVVLFPQLLLALYARKVNGVGALVGAAVGLFLRVGGGEPMIQCPAFLPYPWFDETAGIQFPFRTFAMSCGLVTTLVVSRLTLGRVPPKQLETPRPV